MSRSWPRRPRTIRWERPGPTATPASLLLGRLIEKVTGQTWDTAMRERLFTPLGLTHTVTLPEEALLFGAAVGHMTEGGAEPSGRRSGDCPGRWGRPG